MVVSDGLRSGPIWSKFLNFLEGACPQTHHQCCVLYAHTQLGTARTTPTPSLFIYVCPPLLQSLNLPLKPIEVVEIPKKEQAASEVAIE